MTGTLFNAPRYTPVNNTGRPRAGSKLYFFRAGTSTPAAVYTTASLGTAHAVPVVASAGGEFPAIYLDPDAGYDFKAVLQTSDGVQVWVEDNIPTTMSAEAVGAALYPRSAGEIAGAVTPVQYRYPPGDVRRYYTGSGDHTSALQAALNCGSAVVLEQGATYTITTGLTWNTDYGVIHANNATITTPVDIIGLTIGALGSGNISWAPRIYGNLHLVNTGTSTKQGFLCHHIYEGNLEISATGWGVGIELKSDAHGCVYNDFHLGRISNNTTGLYLNPTLGGWVNENNFYGGRFTINSGTRSYLIHIPKNAGTYGIPNNNTFFGPSLEGSTGTLLAAYFDGGLQNTLYSPRAEISATCSLGEIYISADAVGATVMWPYASYQATQASTNRNVIDNGRESIIFTTDTLKFVPRQAVAAATALEIFRSDPNTAGTPVVSISDCYNGSQASQGMLIEMARSATAGNYVLRADDLGSVVNNDDADYVCILAHTSSAADEPGVGANWATYWRKLPTRGAASTTDWATSTGYSQTLTKFTLDGAGQITQQTHRQITTTTALTSASFVGELCIDTANGKAYVAVSAGTTPASADWVILN